MTNKTLTLGSLFDGSGGFPLGGLLAGITPVWASEIEPFPIRVTTKRLPFMKHYGNISAMDGGRIEPVDIITFGSPCQDMSVAGRRDGLDGKCSSLFYEAVRIIKEMRCATGGRYPRYIVWENVPGAFSSNKGEDFKAVLEAVIGIAEPETEVPMPEKARWPYADLYMGDGWSVAYRTLDAQYWGVPQRRRRIYLVADLAGRGAGKILFESEGLSGYSAEGFRSWQRAAGSFTPCTGATGFDGYNGSLTDDTSATLGVNCGMSTGRNGIVLNDQGGDRMDITEEVTSTLRAEAHHPPCVMESAGFCTEHSAKSRTIGYEEECYPTLRAGVIPAAVALENHPTDSRVKLSEDGNVQTLTSRMGTGGNNVPLVMKIRSGCEGGGKGPLIQENKSATLSCNNDQTLFEPCGWDGGQVSPTLTKQNAGGNQRMPDKDNFTCVLQPFGICSKDSNAMKSDNPHSGIYEAETARNTVDGLVTIRKLKEKGVEVYFEKENIYSLDGKGELLLTIMSSLVQEESRSISENVTWGQRKRFSDGKVSLPYKQFLGYERGEKKDDPPVVNPEQAVVVRRIYRTFMEGKTTGAIAKELTEEGIPTPAGKSKWRASTINSILKNEKYRGSALLQKCFTTDFLTKKQKVNEGEVPQYYIEHSHEAIIDPLEWDAVQDEIRRRKEIGRAYSGTSVFSAKLVCGDCGGRYGHKTLHSTDKYRSAIWRCNQKYSDGKCRCGTTVVTEEEIKDRFISAFNRIISSKKPYIKACKTAKQALTDTTAIDAEMADLLQEIEVVSELTRKCIEKNSAVAQDQKEFNSRYNGYVEKYKTVKKWYDSLAAKRECKLEKAKAIDRFIHVVKSREGLLTEFDPHLWMTTVENVTIMNDGKMLLRFFDGTEISG